MTKPPPSPADEPAWQEIFNATNEAMFIHDAATGRVLDVNDRVLEMFRCTREQALQPELANPGLKEPPYSAEAARAWIRKAVESGPQIFEWRARRPDGEPIWCEISLRRMESGRRDRVMAVVRDITERKKADETLNILKSSVDVVSDAAFWTDREGRFVYVNDAACRSVGRTREELMQLHISEVNPRAHAARWGEIWEQLREQGTRRFESMHRRRDGSEFPVEVVSTYVKAGEREYVCGFARDMTEHKKAEEALAAKEKWYRTLIDLSPAGILLEDTEGNILEANPAICRIFGYSREELCGHNIRMLVPPAQHAEVDRHIVDLLAGKTLFHEVDNVGKDGQLHRVEIHEMTVPMEDGSKNILAVVNDITERRQLEQQLRHLQKMESVGQLAAGVAHDFNNVLTVIIGSSEILLDKLGDEPEGKDLAAQILAAGMRASNLTRQLLLFSRRQQMQPKPVNLNELTSNLTKMLGRVLGEDIKLEFSYENSLPAVQGDPGMLEQVILNLALNSRDAMPQGGSLHIATSTVRFGSLRPPAHPQARLGHFVRLAVTDTGYGIPPENRDRIFEPFFTTKEVGKGTGLGLATVFGIITQHGGWIEVESTVGRGTTFLIYLPVKPAPEPAELGLDARVSGRSHGETILLVEDEATVRDLVRRTLAEHGYKVIEAASGAEAMHTPSSELRGVDLVLTDLVMPGGVNGRELVQKLCAAHPGLRVLYCSGYSPEIAGGRFALERGSAFIQKPFTPRQLLDAVADCLRD